MFKQSKLVSALAIAGVALFGAQAPTLENVFDGLADFIDTHLGPQQLRALLAPASARPGLPP